MKKIIILLLALMITTSATSSITKAKTKEEIENELKQLENKVRENKDNINGYNQKIKEVEQQIAANQVEIARLSKEKIKKEQEKLKLENDLRIVLIESQANINGMKALRSIVNGSSSKSLAEKTTIEQIDNYTKETVQKIANIQDELKKDSDKIAENSRQQQELSATLLNSIKGLEKDNLTNEATMNSVSESNKCTLKPDLEECKPKEPEIYPVAEEETNNNSNNNNNNNNNVPSNSGGWNRPAGAMTQAYGCAFWDGVAYPSGQGCANLHNGMDFDSGMYSSINALRGGVVVRAIDGCPDIKSYCGGGWGNNVVIQHDVNGVTYYSQYAHLARGSVSVSVGQSIQAGNSVGLQGNSGYSLGSHLHFSIYRGSYNGYTNSVNPASLF
jgi:murein DD-endopeptidase MepM/ murein hydrolase activator NlpD